MPFLSSTGYSKIWYAFFSLLEFKIIIEIQNSEDNKFKSANSPGPSVSPKA